MSGEVSSTTRSGKSQFSSPPFFCGSEVRVNSNPTFLSAASEPHHSSFQAPKQLPGEDVYKFEYKETEGES